MIRKILILLGAMWLVILFAQNGGVAGARKLGLPLDSAKRAELIKIGEGVHTVPLCTDQFSLINSVLYQ